MSKKRKIKTFFARIYDFIYFTFKYHNGFTKPIVAIGHFRKNKYGELQKTFFKILQKNNFRRTFFQSVLPGQTAGLIKKADKYSDREFHIRFYKNGKIDCEEEVGRFKLLHYYGNRVNKIEALTDFLSSSPLSEWEKKTISTLFGKNEYISLFNRDNLQTQGIESNN